MFSVQKINKIFQTLKKKDVTNEIQGMCYASLLDRKEIKQYTHVSGASTLYRKFTNLAQCYHLFDLHGAISVHIKISRDS